MNRLHTVAFRLFVASVVLSSCFASRTLAQTPSASPAAEATKTPDTKPATQNGGGSPFCSCRGARATGGNERLRYSRSARLAHAGNVRRG